MVFLRQLEILLTAYYFYIPLQRFNFLVENQIDERGFGLISLCGFERMIICFTTRKIAFDICDHKTVSKQNQVHQKARGAAVAVDEWMNRNEAH